MKNRYIIILFSIMFAVNVPLSTAPTKSQISQALVSIRRKSTSGSAERFIAQQVLEIWDSFISDEWNLMQSLNNSINKTLCEETLTSLTSFNDEINQQLSPKDDYSFAITNGFKKLVSLNRRGLSFLLKRAISTLIEAAKSYQSWLSKRKNELIREIDKQLSAQERKAAALKQKPPATPARKTPNTFLHRRSLTPSTHVAANMADLSSFIAPRERMLHTSLKGLDLEARGFGFYCERQTGAMCGWKSICNSLSLANASQLNGQLAELLKRTRFHTNAFIRRQKRLFEVHTNRNSDEWTSNEDLDAFARFLEQDQSRFERALLLGPTTIGSVELDDRGYQEVEQTIAQLRRSAGSPDEIITFLQNADRALSNTSLGRYTQGNLTISLSEMRTINRIYFSYIRSSQAIIKMFDRGGIVIWVNYHGNHWTCQCLFKDENGKACFGMIDSLSPGNVHLEQRRSKSLLYLVSYGLPLDEFNVKILTRVYAL